MEPYDLRDVIFRRSYPKIGVELFREDVNLNSSYQHIYSLRAVLRNRGPVSLTGFKLYIHIPTQLVDSSDHVHVVGERGADGLDYRRFSTTRPSLEYPAFRLYPDDEVAVVGGRSSSIIRYQMTTQLFTSSVRETAVSFTLDGEDMPPLSDSKSVAELIAF